MEKLNPDCTICQGRGWYETYAYDLEDDPQPCPDCNPVRPITTLEYYVITAFVLLLVGLVVWGTK